MNRSAIGSVIKADDGGWFARLRYTDAEGKKREKKRKFNTKRQAGNAISDLQVEVDVERNGRKTFRELDQFYRLTHVHKAKRVAKVDCKSSKTLSSRLVPLSARSVEMLAQLWHNSVRRQSAAVFGMFDFKRAFKGACDDAKLSNVHFHDLRHTAITRTLEKGISPPLVMKISGHRQMKTFMRYVNQTEASIYDIALKLDMAA